MMKRMTKLCYYLMNKLKGINKPVRKYVKQYLLFNDKEFIQYKLQFDTHMKNEDSYIKMLQKIHYDSMIKEPEK